MSATPAASNLLMLKMGLREYSLQMQHLKLHFSCGGFFNISITSFAGVIHKLICIINYTI